MHSNLRWDVSIDLSATDATHVMRWTTRAQVPYEFAWEMYRGAPHNGEYTRLGWEDPTIGLHTTRLHRCAEEVLQLLPCLKLVDGGGPRFGRFEHVNLQELQALLHELKHTVAHGDGEGLRKIVLIDSRVVVGAWGKRRSSARRLNSLLRCVGRS